MITMSNAEEMMSIFLKFAARHSLPAPLDTDSYEMKLVKMLTILKMIQGELNFLEQTVLSIPDNSPRKIKAWRKFNKLKAV